MQRQLLVNHMTQKRKLLHDIMTQITPKDSTKLTLYGPFTDWNGAGPSFKSYLHTVFWKIFFQFQVLSIGDSI